MSEQYMTLREFCETTRISSSTVYRMIKAGSLPAIKIQRNWKVPRSFLIHISNKKNTY